MLGRKMLGRGLTIIMWGEVMTEGRLLLLGGPLGVLLLGRLPLLLGGPLGVLLWKALSNGLPHQARGIPRRASDPPGRLARKAC